MIFTIIEELESDQVFWDWISDDDTLKNDPSKLFIFRNVDSAHYAYHLDKYPVKIHEYCFSDRTYNNIFEIIEEQVIKPGEVWKRILKK